MWYLNDNVYFVAGKINGAFYDFNHGRLVHVSKDAKELLRKIPSNESFTPTQNEREYLNRLTELHLLTQEYTQPHEISDLRENPVIDFVWVEVTDICNLKCLHCYNKSESHCGRVMPYDDFCRVIDELVAFSVKKIQIIGGEPLTLGDELTRYLDYLDGKFDYKEIFTNGTLLTDSMTDYFRQHGIRVALSLYSYMAGEHDKVTGQKGSWEKTNGAIQKLQRNNIPYAVKNVLMKGVEIGEKNTDLYTLSTVKDVVRLTGRASASLLTRELARKRLITKKSFQRRITKGFVKRCLSGHNCFSRRLYFASDLTVYPCVMERRISHGNLRGNRLNDIINPTITAMNKDSIPSCHKCEFRYCCHDCRPDSNGMSLDSKTWYCTYDPDAGKWTDPEKFLDSLSLD